MNKNVLLLVSEMSTHLMEVHNALHSSNVTVIHAENTHDAKAGLESHSPAFVLLDFDIKGADFLLDHIAFGPQRITQPYIMVAAPYADGNDRAAMLKRGADHCVDKPINAQEVLAVISSVLRRNKHAHTFKYKDLIINKSRRSVTMREEPVTLTRKEYQVLCFLADHAGTILTKVSICRTDYNTQYLPYQSCFAETAEIVPRQCFS